VGRIAAVFVNKVASTFGEFKIGVAIVRINQLGRFTDDRQIAEEKCIILPIALFVWIPQQEILIIGFNSLLPGFNKKVVCQVDFRAIAGVILTQHNAV